MVEIADFFEFLEQEQQLQGRANELRNAQSIETLAFSGYAIRGLKVTNQNSTTIETYCKENYSRFRPGDRMEIKGDGISPIKVTLIEVSKNGRKLIFQGKNFPQIEGNQKLDAIENTVDLNDSIKSSIIEVLPGAPGWNYFRRVIGEMKIPQIQRKYSCEETLNSLLEETGKKFDYSQKEAFSFCFTTPPLQAIQGPPGTGKTLVISYVIEALIRNNKRVILLAPTHQAVNNALSTLHGLFPNRNVKKFGDELRKRIAFGRYFLCTIR